MGTTSTALIVEDDEDIAFLIEFVLRQQGYHVSVSSDGKEALAMLDSSLPPALVVMDLMLPFSDGISLVKHLRAKPAWKAVPVLMLTAKSQEGDMVQAMKAGASDYLTKPFQPMELIMRVQRVTGSV